jgi:hypothetical protein
MDCEIQARASSGLVAGPPAGGRSLAQLASNTT